MFRIIAIMFLGVAIGYLLRRMRGVGMVSVTTMLTIVLLLFIMGIEIGSNQDVVRNLLSLGGEALAIACAATLGSVLAARYLYKRWFSVKQGGNAQ